MSRYRAAIIGCGRPGGTPPGVAEGFAIGYTHARAYRAIQAVDLVAAADIDPDNLAAFARTFEIGATYRDYQELLARERPDLVSICTWPPLHPDMVVVAARAGVRGILCEKPMALGLGEADRMLDACARAGTVLSINHQRRLVRPWTTARAWLAAGRIGKLLRMEGWVSGGWDLLSWGTHWADMFFFFTGDQPAQWVFAQIECSRRQRRYGHPVEDRSLTMVGFADGVTGLLHLAPEAADSAAMRLIGSEGQIHVGGSQGLRLVGGIAPDPASEARDGEDGFVAAIRDLIRAIETGEEPRLSGRHGRQVTEVLMAAYASGLEQRLVTLPYTDPAFPLARVFEDVESPGETN